jgi:UDPglucose 6-dehydrogenase
MKLCVVGTGYVGLVAGTCFAEGGNDVICVDNVAAKIDALRRGEVPIYEPGLEELIRRNVAEGRLSFSTDLPDAVRKSRVCFIAVGTPENEDGSADLSAVLAVGRGIAQAMDGHRVVVTKSTVPVATHVKIRAAMEPITQHPFDVVSNPEFMKEGAAIEDFLKPDRVVIGAASAEAFKIMRELYEPFVRTGAPIIEMDNASAEMTKYAANALLATRISFMNEIANLCEKVGANVDLVRKGIGTDARIGPSFLFPGPGYGGSCFPKDVKALVRTAGEAGSRLSVLEAVEDANERQKHRLFEKLQCALGDSLGGAHIAVWGLAFKPQTDDMREAPALTLIDDLLAAGATITAHDPAALHEAKRRLGDRVGFADSNYDALAGADALVVVTDWNEYRHPDFARIKATLRRPVLVDGRNLYDVAKMQSLGFAYYSLGRGRDGA